MGKFANVFAGINNAKPMGDFLEKLGLGKHKLALTRYMPKTSSQDDSSTILEADFLVLESTVPNLAGSYRGYAWWLDAAGHGKSYERDRAKKFIESVIACFTQPSDQQALAQLCQQITPGCAGIDVQTFGDLMAYDQQPLVGVTVMCEISERYNKKKGRNYSHAEWTPLPTTLEQVMLFGQKLKQLQAAAAAQVAANHPNAPGGGAQIPHAAQPQVQPQVQPAPVQQPIAMPGVGGLQFPGVQTAPAAAPNPGMAALMATLKTGG